MAALRGTAITLTRRSGRSSSASFSRAHGSWLAQTLAALVRALMGSGARCRQYSTHDALACTLVHRYVRSWPCILARVGQRLCSRGAELPRLLCIDVVDLEVTLQGDYGAPASTPGANHL